MIFPKATLSLAISLALTMTVGLRAEGTLYIANYGGSTIDAADSSGNLSTLVSDALSPSFLTADSAGNIYASLGNYVIEKYSSTGTDLGVYASGFNVPQGLAFDSSASLFVANSSGNSILKITSGGDRSTFASGLNFPVGLAINSQGNVFVGNLFDNSIAVYNPAGTLLQTITDGLISPGQLTFDSAGNLFVANQNVNGSGHFTIQEYLALPGGTVSTTATQFFDAGTDNHPTGLAFDQSGNLYASYTYVEQGEGNPVIEKISSTGTDLGVFASGGNLNTPLGLLYVTPEPSSWALLLFGLCALIPFRRRQSQK